MCTQDVQDALGMGSDVRAARAENYRAAQAQATTLRELAGRANNELYRLGLNACMLRSSGMPL